jgi:GTP diphosphokinase / guanosine-3',5'-bis(diphosphate) 3'-diphosphatase
MPGADTDKALTFLRDAYASRLRRKGRTAEHPIAVSELLREDGQPPDLVLAGLLHDVLEDTNVAPEELRRQFGPDVTRLVEALTQDESIPKHRARKAALRQQILDAGPEAATVALADKAAKLSSERVRPKDRRLDHYRETLTGVEQRYGRSRLSERLREELARFPDGANGSEPH